MQYEYIQRKTPYCVAVINSRTRKLEYWKTLEDMNISALHILDETFSWYHDCLDEARWLIDKYKPKRLVGSSMGGYAALLLGALHGIHVKAFGPQTTLKADWDKRWQTDLEKIAETTKYPEYLDLLFIEPAILGDIYYCNGSQEDIQHARRMKGKAELISRGCIRHEDSAIGIHPCEVFDI